MNHDIRPDASSLHPSSAPQFVLRRSMAGEYLSLLLMLHAGFGALIWCAFSIQSPAGLLIAALGLWIACRARGMFSERGLTPLVTAGMMATAFVFWWNFDNSPPPPYQLFSVPAFLGMLGAVLLVDIYEIATADGPMSDRFQGWNWHRIAVWAFVAVFMAYILVAPIASSLIEHLDPPQSALERMSLSEQMQLRTMEAMTAFWFFAVGAAIGSFLNVVAYRMPLGESVVFRRSRCPKCQTEIKGRDNVPILGWLLLNGRCRACQTPISYRYPIVESITASIFLLLYFVELISGGANIPVRHPNIYTGVVWIIFYAKWDLIALYLFHCFTISALLAWALIDLDRQRVPWRAAVSMGAVLFALPALAGGLDRVISLADQLDLLPVPWQLRKVDVGFMPPDLFAVLATSTLGGLTGGLLGFLAAQSISFRASKPLGGETLPEHGEEGRSEDKSESNTAQAGKAEASREPSPHRIHLISAGIIVGLTLGWQAAVGVWLLTFALRPLAHIVARRWNVSELPATALLLAAFLIQLVCWRLLTVDWWPSITTAPLAWAAWPVAFILLCLANRALPALRRREPGLVARAEDELGTLELPAADLGAAAHESDG